VNGQLPELAAALALAASMLGLLAAFCAAGPVLDRIHDRRLARRRQVEQAVARYRPIRLAQWTGHGWAEVRPLAGAR
jgi:hypothetical protein